MKDEAFLEAAFIVGAVLWFLFLLVCWRAPIAPHCDGYVCTAAVDGGAQ